MFDWKNAIVLHAKKGIGPHLAVTENSYGFSRVAAATWVIFSSYSGDGHSKLTFVQ